MDAKTVQSQRYNEIADVLQSPRYGTAYRPLHFLSRVTDEKKQELVGVLVNAYATFSQEPQDHQKEVMTRLMKERTVNASDKDAYLRQVREYSCRAKNINKALDCYEKIIDSEISDKKPLFEDWYGQGYASLLGGEKRGHVETQCNQWVKQEWERLELPAFFAKLKKAYPDAQNTVELEGHAALYWLKKHKDTNSRNGELTGTMRNLTEIARWNLKKGKLRVGAVHSDFKVKQFEILKSILAEKLVENEEIGVNQALLELAEEQKAVSPESDEFMFLLEMILIYGQDIEASIKIFRELNKRPDEATTKTTIEARREAFLSEAKEGACSLPDGDACPSNNSSLASSRGGSPTVFFAGCRSTYL